MASSHSNVSPWKRFLLLLSLALQVIDATESLPFINATSLEVGFLWEHPREENHHSTHVVVADNHLGSVLSLICFISPPLLHTPEYERKKNDLVRWEKITIRGAEPIDDVRYWANDRGTVAIKYDNVTSDVIGSYRCSYGQLSKLIHVKVANVDIVKALKMPTTYEEVENYATHMVNTTGITGWNNDKTLSQSKGSSLSCKTSVVAKSKDSPSTIHTVRPSDIKVIAAVGDGFTAGLGAKATSWNGFFTEYRGTSWSIGGQGYLNQNTTLPNIFKEFHPQLGGYSTQSKQSFELNMATPFSSSWDLENQVNQLITTMQSDKGIDFKNDWKVLTILTGATDLCHICQDPDRYSGSNYIKNVMHSLNILKNKVPRLYVNLVPPMDVTVLYELYHDKKPSCHILGWSACPCAATQDITTRENVSKAAKNFTSLLEKAVNSGIYDVTDQFTVVIQPFMKDGPRNKTGGLALGVFGPDCLHFNTKGHAAAAVALWNNMLEPLYDKNAKWNTEQSLKCPFNGRLFLSTKVNSKAVTAIDDDTSPDTLHPAGAIVLSVFLAVVVLLVTVYVWLSRKSRPNTDTIRLLEFPLRPRL